MPIGRPWVPRIKRTCEQCGKTFEVKESTLQHSPARWCSIKCAGLARRGKPAHNRILPPDEDIAKEYESGNSSRAIALVKVMSEWHLAGNVSR